MKAINELAAQAAALLASQEGFTLTAEGTPLESGYVVGGLVRAEGHALAQLEQPHTAADYAALVDRVTDTLERHRAALEAQPGVAIGGWRQGDSLSLDLVTIHTSGRQAAKTALEREQLAYGRLEGYRYAEELHA